MTEEEKKAITQLLWYKQLFDKGYCQDCNELCSSGASIPGKDLSESIKIILNLIQKLQEENLDVKKELEKKDIIIDFIKEEREHIKSNLETDLNRKGIYSQSKGQIQQISEYYKNNDKKINIILKEKVM